MDVVNGKYLGDVKRSEVHKNALKRRAAKQRAKRAAKRAVDHNLKLGTLHYVKVMSGICPHNTRRGTEYLVPADSICLAEKVERYGSCWWILYPTQGRLFDGIGEVREKVKGIRCERHEFKMTNKPVVFRSADKVALKAMLPKDWGKNADQYMDKIRQVYPL